MRHWKNTLLALALSLSTFPAVPNAAAQTSCLSPNESSAVTVVKAIQSVCVLAKEAAPDGKIDPLLGEEVNESIKLIGGRLDAPNPFGKCWYDSRFDCLKAKEAVGALTDQVSAFDDLQYVDKEVAKATRQKRDAIAKAKDTLVDDIHAFCNTLRH